MSNLFLVSNELKDDHQLSPFIRSSNQVYSAVIQGDGNFVIYDEVKKMNLWSSGTAGKGTGPYRLAMQDGNLVLYDGQHRMQWSTNTKDTGKGPHKLRMDDDGHLRIYDSEKNVIWWRPHASIFDPSTPMTNGQSIVSLNGNYCAGMKPFIVDNVQYDTFIEYKTGDVNNPSKYLLNFGTRKPTTPYPADSNYLWLHDTGPLGVYVSPPPPAVGQVPLNTLPLMAPNVIAPFYMKINNDGSLIVYGVDKTTGDTAISYTLYAPSSC